MKFLSLLIFLFSLCLFACKKNPSIDPNVKIINDSIRVINAGAFHYELDLNDDGLKDIVFFGSVYDDHFEASELLSVHILNPEIKAHQITEIQQTCCDTELVTGGQVLNFHLCPGGGNLYKTDTVQYSPGLQKTDLVSTVFSASNTDTVNLYKLESGYFPPPFPAASIYKYSYGSFIHGGSWYILFKSGTRKVAVMLTLRMSYLVFAQKQWVD